MIRIRRRRSSGRAGVGGRRRRAGRPCPQGLAERLVAEGEPRRPAARLRRVYRLKAAMPACRGDQRRHRGLAEAGAHLAHVDGVMLGRAAYHEPCRLLAVDRLFGEAAPNAAGRTY